MLSKKIKSIAIIASFLTVSGFAFNTSVKAYPGVHSTKAFTTRLGGADRYDTNIKIAEEFAKNNKVDTAILASGIDYPDSLSSAPLTKIYNAPIFITEKNRLTPKIEAEMKKLGIKHVIIVGGTGVVSEAVNSRLKSLGMTTERLAGADRYATSLAIASRAADKFIEKNGKLKELLVSIPDYVSVLSLAPVSCGDNAPIVLVKPNSTKISDNPGLQEYLDKYVPAEQKKDHAVFATFATNVPYELQEDLPSGVAGGGFSDLDKDKYLCNLGINSMFTAILDSSTLVIANGQNFPDALGGAALAGKYQAPVLFVGNDMRDKFRIETNFNIPGYPTEMYIDATKAEAPILTEYKSSKGVYLLGGTAVVPDNAVNHFR